jgi:hypothetical protein
MRTRALWRFDEVSAAQRPIDAIAAVAELNQCPIEFGTAAWMRRAIGWANWQAGWHFNELAGNTLAAFGSPTLTAAGSPLYGLVGAKGSDRAVGFDSSGDRFQGGTGDFEVGASDDIVMGWLAFLPADLAVAGVNDIVRKLDTPGGYRLYMYRNSSSSCGLAFQVNDGVDSAFAVTDNALAALNVGGWHCGLAGMSRSVSQSRVATYNLATGVATVGAAASTAAIGSMACPAANFTVGNVLSTPWYLSRLFVGKAPGGAEGIIANMATAIANFGAAILSVPSVVDAAAGRGRSFVALSGHGFEGADIVPGDTLVTRDCSVQALVRWDFAEQAGSTLWSLTKTGGVDATFDDGASSVQTLTGDGYLEAVGPASDSGVIGFTEPPDPGVGFAGIGWGIAWSSGGILGAYRLGANVFSSTWVTGDVVRIRRVGSTFSVEKNGATIYTFAATSSAPVVIDAAMYRTTNPAFLDIQLVSAGVRVPITWQNLVNVTATPSEHRGALYVRGKGTGAAEYHNAGVELRVVNAAQNVGELAWLWQDTAGVLKRQAGGHFTPPASGYVLLTATRKWISTTKVLLRYYVDGRMVTEVESVDGSIGGGTTGTTSIGSRFNGSIWGDFFDGVIDELRVVDYELAPEEVEATWKRLTFDQPQGYQLVRELHPPGFPISDDPSSRVQRETNLWGQALGFASAQGENIRANVLPDRAYGDILDRWERIVGAVPRNGDTLDTRRARVIGRLRARAGVSIPGIQAALEELVATDPDNLEILGFSPEVFEKYQEPTVWAFDTFRPGGVLQSWDPLFPSGHKKRTSIIKVSGADATWNAGASTVETWSGDIQVEVTVAPINTSGRLNFGFNVTDAATTDTDPLYALTMVNPGTLDVIEAGVLKFTTTYAVGDRLQIKRTGTTVTYHKNDAAAFYTSATASSGPIRVDVAIRTLWNEVFRLYMSDGTLPTWQNKTNVEIYSDGMELSRSGISMEFSGAVKDWTTANQGIAASNSYKGSFSGVALPLEGYGAFLSTRLDPLVVPANAEVGIAFLNNPDGNALLFGLRNDAGAYKLITEQILGNVSQGVTERATSSLVPHFLKLYSVAPVPPLYVAPSTSAWDMIAAWSTQGENVALTSYAFTFRPRFQWAILYCRSWGGATPASATQADWQATRLWAPYGDRSFYFYAYRDPALAGSADVEAAHYALQGLKQAHTIGTLITSKSVKYDTDGTGYDRGPLGGY